MYSKRLMWVDWLKFLAIFGIIGIHVSSHFIDYNLFTPEWYSGIFAMSMFRYGIVIFVMVSGYLVLRKQQPISTIPKRFKRIVIPFVFWLVVYVVVKFVFTNKLGDSLNLFDLISFIVKGFLNPTIASVQFWYVYMILGLYMLSPILSRWIQNAPIKEIEYFLVVWAILTFIQFLNIDTLLLDYFSYFLGTIGYFVLGYYLTIKESDLLKSQRFGFALLIVGILITFIGTAVFSIMAHDLSLFFIRLCDLTPGACLEAIGLFIIIKNFNFEIIEPIFNRIATKISMESYGIYLVNILVINVIFLMPIKLTSLVFLKIFLITIIVFVICCVIIGAMNRIPILDRIHNY